jgi:ferredoxin-NADP reductase
MSDGGGWRQLRIARRVAETENILSLRLEAADDRPLARFRPGQFLTFRLRDADGRASPRNYSLTSDPADGSQYRISVRRHEAGFGSGIMWSAAEGDLLEATEPKGRFVLDDASHRPVILLAAGIGITPLMAMAQALAATARPGFLIQSCRDTASRPFAAELEALAGRAGNLTVTAVQTGSEGRVTSQTLRRLLPIGDYEAYLCGPQGFMDAMTDLLIGLGVRPERIASESFGGAKPVSVAAPPVASGAGDGIRVTFARSGRTAIWDGAQRTLLDFAEAQGLTPAFSCRNGICGTCVCGVEGDIRYVEEPLEEPGPGKALLCCSAPVGPVTLAL